MPSPRRKMRTCTCPTTCMWWEDSHHEALLINYLIPSVAGKLLSNLIASRTFLLSSLNWFVAASSPLLVPVPSFHLSSSSPSLESSLHQSSFCQAEARTPPLWGALCPHHHPSLFHFEATPGWAGLCSLPGGLGLSEFHSAARYSTWMG